MLPVQRPELESIYWQTVGRKIRTICVTAGTPGEGVSELVVALGRRGAAAGLNTLLIDANLPRPSISLQLGLPAAVWSLVGESARRAIAFSDRIGLAVLPAPVGVDTLSLRDPEKWRAMFEQELAEYELIIVDASPVNTFSDAAVPAESIAAGCAATVLVALTGVTPERALRAAAERLTTASAPISGVVLNDRFNPSLSDELCRVVEPIARLAPTLGKWLQRRIRSSAVLNMPS